MSAKSPTSHAELQIVSSRLTTAFNASAQGGGAGACSKESAGACSKESAGACSKESASSSLPSPFRKLLSQTGVHAKLVGEIADALSEDGVTNAHALECVPLHPDDHPETFKVLDAALPAEKAVVKASLADLGPPPSTAGAHTGDEATPTPRSEAVKEAALKGINELQLLKAGLQPFIDNATNAEDGAQEKSKVAEKEAVDSARAKLLELHALKLPSNSTPGAAARYLDLAMGKLKLDVLPQQADLSVTDLVERNELMQCVHLHPSGADIAPCPVGQLHPGRSPFKNPRGPSYRLEDTDVETTKRHASMRQLDETVGSSWSVAASTKGAVFFGFGVAAWSASMSAAGAKETKSSEIHETSSEATTSVKVKQAILSGAQFSLADRDWELTPDFESRLAEFVAIDEGHVTGLSDVEAHRRKQAVLAKRLLDDYGSHLATQAVLGGRYKIECHVTTELKTEKHDKRKAVADALNCHASVAASAAGFFEVFAGAGESARSTGHASHTAAQSALQEMDETTSMKTMLRMTVTGGAPGNMAAWLNDLRKSNRGWEVVDRSPHRGLSPIWDLVRKSRRLSAEEQTEVSNSVKACFENGFKAAKAAAKAAVEAAAVQYGDSIHLKNGFNEKTYLDSKGMSEHGRYDVSTALSPSPRGKNTSDWAIEPVDAGISGAVQFGDSIYLKNGFNEKTYLNSKGMSKHGRYDVSTALSPSPLGKNTSVWTIEPVDAGKSGLVNPGDSIYLKNGFNEKTYLDSKGMSEHGRYDVSTALSPSPRGKNTSVWTIEPAN